MKYYELTRDFFAPGLPEARRGTRKTKEEWVAIYPALTEDHFNYFNSLFKEYDDRDPEVDICVQIISGAMELPHTCSRSSLKSLLQVLRDKEANAGDVAKAYGLRIASDVVREFIDRQDDPTKEVIEDRVRRAWAKRLERQ